MRPAIGEFPTVKYRQVCSAGLLYTDVTSFLSTPHSIPIPNVAEVIKTASLFTGGFVFLFAVRNLRTTGRENLRHSPITIDNALNHYAVTIVVAPVLAKYH